MILLTGGLKYCVDCHTYLTIAVNYLYTIIARVINILYSMIKICPRLTVKYKNASAIWITIYNCCIDPFFFLFYSFPFYKAKTNWRCICTGIKLNRGPVFPRSLKFRLGPWIFFLNWRPGGYWKIGYFMC